jgi:hypothetical protein
MQMPMEVRLKLVPVLCANGMDPREKPGHDKIDEGYGFILGMPVVDFQGKDSYCIIDSRILESFYRRAIGSLDGQKFHIHLNMVSGNLFLVSVSNYGMLLCVLGETFQAMAFETPVDAPGRDFHSMVAFEIFLR